MVVAANNEGERDAVAEMADNLATWAREVRGPSATVSAVRKMPGNAGLSYGFQVDEDGKSEQFVIRLSPPGVKKQGNTDVLRQVPLLNVLDANGIPVSQVIWSSEDPRWFGTDAFVQKWLDGMALHMRTPDPSLLTRPEDSVPYVESMAKIIARIHRIDWQNELEGWESPRDLDADIDFWRSLQAKSAEPEMGEHAEKLAVRLHETLPTSPRIGIFHGDFHPNNVMFRPGGEITGVVDWEISGIGASALDIGWLSTFTDRSCWAPGYRERMQVVADPARVLDTYQEALGEEVVQPGWYKAYACYRFGVIAAFNLRLHRKGYRPDEHYEELATSTFALTDKGLELLDDPASF